MVATKFWNIMAKLKNLPQDQISSFSCLRALGGVPSWAKLAGCRWAGGQPHVVIGNLAGTYDVVDAHVGMGFPK